ncbi:hypothetical protein QCD60_08160 [Pokkaliibacter sp. MBI-7]|uniref:hypothetical protein n=1 Tax=Pokkaliibacter sp. MBI-7 TaxID=3040600 RepID=UPI0024487653|nr:hypothetical protein [Pokkaliibacter sp. MBI-7]MDH2432537.1 hypothetical protein [Pokkaliibacter sp. MBI-7]
MELLLWLGAGNTTVPFLLYPFCQLDTVRLHFAMMNIHCLVAPGETIAGPVVSGLA